MSQLLNYNNMLPSWQWRFLLRFLSVIHTSRHTDYKAYTGPVSGDLTPTTTSLPSTSKLRLFLISNIRRVLYVLCFLLSNSPASEFYMPMFRNTETSAYKIQTPGNYPDENIQQT